MKRKVFIDAVENRVVCEKCGATLTLLCGKCSGHEGARASARAYSIKQYKKWGKLGGRPKKK